MKLKRSVIKDVCMLRKVLNFIRNLRSSMLILSFIQKTSVRKSRKRKTNKKMPNQKSRPRKTNSSLKKRNSFRRNKTFMLLLMKNGTITGNNNIKLEELRKCRRSSEDLNVRRNGGYRMRLKRRKEMKRKLRD